MKKLILAIVLILVSSASYADELQDYVNEFTRGVAELIPGEGHTEISIDLRENHGPDYSILGVREIAPIENGTVFTQFSLFNTEVPSGKPKGDERTIGNIGLGVRKLTHDNTIMIGVNNFWDTSIEEEHLRTSLGLEARSAVLEMNYNRYIGVGDTYSQEHVLDGHTFQLTSQVPYLHWAKAFYNMYQWEGVDRADVNGVKLGSEMQLTPNFNLEVAYDDKDREGLDDEWYTKLQFIHPGQAGPTALDGVSDVAWKENKDMSGELLSKVRRQNKIMIEFKGTSSISRTD